MIGRLTRNTWTLAAATLVFGLLMVRLIAGGTAAGEGRFIYPVDDAYIHLALARNLAVHHVWGITSHEFSSASSSPLWTLMLAAACAVTGDHDLTPLVLNVLCAVGALALLHAWLRARTNSSLIVLPLLILFTLAAPLPFLVSLGMEHTLHIALLALFVMQLDAAFTRPETTPRQTWTLALLAALMVAARFEGLFIVAAAGLALFGARRWKTGLTLWTAAWVPVLIYGLFSLHHGGYFLPNTLLIKGNKPPRTLAALGPALKHFYSVLLLNPAILTLLLLCAVAWVRSLGRGAKGAPLPAIFIGTLVLHTILAQFGPYYRYEAYLVALGFMALTCPIGSGVFTPPRMAGAGRLTQWLAVASLVLATVMPMVPRALDSWRFGPVASRNIYDQQFQMASFIKRFFPNEEVALNDIGMAAYIADPRLFDMVGLATQSVIAAKAAHAYDLKKVDELTRARGVQFAMIYDIWFAGQIPPQWVKVGQWRGLNNYICASDTISIYAVNPPFAARLSESLRQFGKEMPPDVIQSGLYTQAGK